MRTLIIFLFAGCFILSYCPVRAQSEEYIIESFQSQYNELSDYESMSSIFGGDPLWEYEFQLNFQFPFYGGLYNKVTYLFDAWGFLTENDDSAFYLMEFSRGCMYASLNDTTNIESDVRFSHVVANNMQAFVIQFTNNGFFADPFADSLDTYLNFQLWFFENGVLEVHFGEMHMDGSPIYAPGKGFYCYSSSGGVDTNEICGPHVGISNPLNWEDGIAVSGPYNDYEVVDDIYADLTLLPPEGWVIRFLPRSVGIFGPQPTNN